MYNKIFQKIIFPIAELYSGTTIQKKLKFLLKSQYWSRKKIEGYQNKRLRELMEHAYTNVPYYTKLFDKLRLKPSDIKTKKDLKKLPILTKEIIRKNAEELRAKNYLRKSYQSFTSGSTGTPMIFYLTKEDFSWIWAAHFRKFTWAGCEYGDKYVKISLNNSRVKVSKKVQDTLMRCHYIYSDKLNDAAIKTYLDKIRKFSPKFIYGYSSSLNIIANYINQNKISINVKAIISTGDNLLSLYRKNIEKAFKCKVYDEYGCGGEGLNIAAQCSKGHYHVNDELIILEEINKQAIVTSLNNYAMPLIRYTPNDLITLGDNACKLNLSTIKSIDGRSKDVVITPKSNLIVHFFTILFEYIKGVEQFKIIQKEKQGIIIQIVKNHNFKDENRIISKIHQAAGRNFKVKIEYVSHILPEKNGKMKIIDNRLK